MSMFNEPIAARALGFAQHAWSDWRDMFEHIGPWEDNPVLADPSRYRSFVTKWSVSRTLRNGTHDAFRQRLLVSPEFAAAIKDDTGKLLDKCERKLRSDFGTQDGTHGVISVLSKIATFCRPERFVAWDTYAKKGINVIMGRGPYTAFAAYADYLEAFEEIRDGKLGMQVVDYARQHAQNTIETEPRFTRRVLDLYHMECGRSPAAQGRKVARFLQSHYAAGRS